MSQNEFALPLCLLQEDFVLVLFGIFIQAKSPSDFMKVARSFLIWASFLLLTSCSTVVREIQRSEAERAEPAIMVDGTSVHVSASVWQWPSGGGSRALLAGRVVIKGQDNQRIPGSVDLYHFQVVTRGFTGWLTNYRRKSDGRWTDLGHGGGILSADTNTAPSAVVTRTAETIVLEFRLDHYDRSAKSFDIALSLSDSLGKRHIILAEKVPLGKMASNETGAANGSQPFNSETNGTSSAAGFGR